MTTIYPIIVTYNGLKWIDRCLESLRGSTVPLHTIVVDNASTDGTADHVAARYPEVELIRSPHNLGFGKGNNIGLRRALDDKADYVFLLNQDAWIEPAAIEILVARHRSNPAFGILSPVHLNADWKSLEYIFSEFAGSGNTPGFYADLYAGSLKEVYPTRFVNAAAWLISAGCLQKIGGFNPVFPHYGEDNDYVNRVHNGGFEVGIVPASRVVHDSFFSWDKINNDPQRLYISNLVKLSNPGHRFRSAALLYAKEAIDELTSLLLFRKFKKLSIRHKVFWRTLFALSTIRKYRRLSALPAAFLQ
jgi:GT2 family glycosyltransferase